MEGGCRNVIWVVGRQTKERKKKLYHKKKNISVIFPATVQSTSGVTLSIPLPLFPIFEGIYHHHIFLSGQIVCHLYSCATVITFKDAHEYQWHIILLSP